ncbi:hypothetical protein ACYX79_13185 [Stenotrophomonas rhizophila]
MDYPVTIRIESAELLVSLDPGSQPEIRIVALLCNGRRLQDDAAHDLSALKWEVTIEREVAKVEGVLGFASITALHGQPTGISAGYRADPDAFDRLDQLLARNSSGVELQLYIDGMARDPGEELVRWKGDRFGSPIHAVHATLAY